MKNLLKVKSNKEIARNIFEIKLFGDFDPAEFTPGKFLHVKCGEGIYPLLRRPMSICDIDDAGQTLTVLYRKEGVGTSLLSTKEEGDIVDLLGPLGTGFELRVQPGAKVLLMGGGIGVPPLYYLGRKLKEQGAKLSAVLGFASAADVFYEKEFADFASVTITTIDGSHGSRGLVTDVLTEDFDVLYSCGPNAMLAALQKLVPETKHAYMSLEERMGCGVGVCLACVCKPSANYHSESGYVRACTEGPVFALHDIQLSQGQV